MTINAGATANDMSSMLIGGNFLLSGSSLQIETGELIGNYAKELDYLVRNNHKPVNVSPTQWESIKGWFKLFTTRICIA